MTDDHDISYSYRMGEVNSTPDSAKNKSHSTAENEGLYAYDHIEALALPDGNVLLVSKSCGKKLTVTRDVSIALEYCQEFRSLREHANFLVSYMPELGGDEAGVQRVLASVKDAGFLTSAEDICQRINQKPDSKAHSTPTCVCIITCDRPVAVERLLESMLRGAKLSLHEKFYLVDDSRDHLNAAKNQSAVDSFNLSSPKNISYIGKKQQQQLLQELISALPEHEQGVRFLIDREKWASFKSYGLPRTVCLLLSVDYRCIIMDDDVICSAIEPPCKDAGVEFADNMRDVDFYATAQEWQSQAIPSTNDPLSGHARCLGKDFSHALMALGIEALDQQDLANSDINLLKSLNADTPVLVTQCGSFGDPGTAGNSWLTHLRDDSLNRLVNSPGGLSSAFSNRQYWLGRSAPTFSKHATMSQVTGLDNSYTLPPYFPIFRGEDLIFGCVLNFLYPDSIVLEYDWAVPHMPIEERQGNIEGDSAKVTGSLELCTDYITARNTLDPSVSFNTRLETLSLLLLEISENSSTGILSKFRSELSRTQVETVKSIGDKLRAATSQPQDWITYLERCMADNVNTLHSTSTLRDIPGITEGMDEESIVEQIKTYAYEYSRALRAWPAIRKAAAPIVNNL